MSTEKVVNVNASSVPVAVSKEEMTEALRGNDSAKMDLLLNLLLGQKERELKEQEAKQRGVDQQDFTARQESKAYFQKKVTDQSRCSHMKGNGTRTPSQAIDYNIGTHQYIDGRFEKKCLTCKAKWEQSDTKEFFVRNGRKFHNWTGFGWDEVSRWPSTNKITRSEIPAAGKPESVPTSEDGTELPDMQF